MAPAVTAFAAAVAAEVLRKHDGFLLWAASQADCYAPGLVRLGLDPSRIVWVECAKDAEVLSVMEEALHSRALAAVLGEADALSLKTARRLDAAARQSGTTALLLRRHRSKPSDAAMPGCGAAATRWRVSACLVNLKTPSSRPLPEGRRDASPSGRACFERSLSPWGEDGLGVDGGSQSPASARRACRLDLEYCRNGRTASWIVEVSDGARYDNAEAGHVRVVAELRDDACPPEAAPAREAHEPLVLIEKCGNIRRIAALDGPAIRAGLYLHQPLADALAIYPKLIVADAEPGSLRERADGACRLGAAL